MLYKIHEQRTPNVLSYFRDHKIDLAINVVNRYNQKEVDDDFAMRRFAIDVNIPLFTKIKQARLFTRSLVQKDLATVPIKSWNEY